MTLPYSIKQHDNDPSLRATLTDGTGAAIDLTGAAVVFRMRARKGHKTVTGTCAIESPLAGKVRYDWQPGDTDTAGLFRAELEATLGNGRVETIPNDGYIEVNVIADLDDPGPPSTPSPPPSILDGQGIVWDVPTNRWVAQDLATSASLTAHTSLTTGAHGLAGLLAAKEATANKGQPSGYASLGPTGRVTGVQLTGYGLAVGRGGCVVPVGVNQKSNAGTLSNGTDTTGEFEFFVPLTDPTVGAVLPVFTGWQGISDALDPNDIVFAVAVKMSDGTIQPFTFNGGSHLATLKPGAILVPDAPLGFGLQVTPAGQPSSGVWMRTFVDVSAQGASAKWYENNDARLVTGGSGELGKRGAALADLTLAGSGAIVGGSNGNVFGPTLVLGNPRATRKPIVAVIGDSIWEGAQDGSLTYGFISRAARALGYPIVKVAKGSEKAQDFATVANRKYRMALLDGCTHALVGYGTNDLVNNTRTAANVQADMVTTWKALKALGMYVNQATVPPRSTSTDSFATVINQTASGSGGTTDPVRLAAVNGWLRAGAPLDPTLLTPVAIGTLGAVVIGGATHPCDQVFDFNFYCDSGVDTGKWQANGTASIWTSDGTHPRPGMHQGTVGNLLADTTTLLSGWAV